MARVFKKLTTKKCPDTGKSIQKKSKKWYLEFTNEFGKKVRQAGSTDKSVAQNLLSNRLKEVELRRLDLYSAFEEHAKKTLLEHLDEYRDDLVAREVSEKQVRQIYDRTKKIFSECRFQFPRDLDELAVQKFIQNLQAQGRAAQTLNHYLRAVKQFSAWLTKKRRIPEDPLKQLGVCPRTPVTLEIFGLVG